ncbi:MAG TPA: (2Fe-2S)-binding protein [Candidatus Thioglobus sp.]|jgi:predicted molibdopterin-dependent oxidoreductase YjgC|nr:(2Fe-2S)-binding protein [Candidatus Thioglobus sp.]HIL41863.1 (2Fe-2S)-binding protein [Gammaproteobacteria bacterium]
MFERININENQVDKLSFTFDGKVVSAYQGDTVAAALLGAGYKCFRETPVLGLNRNPYCMMGSCYDCLVSIGGRNVQSCMVECEQGMVVERVSHTKLTGIRPHEVS